MNATGAVRKIDELGRVVIPKSIRSKFDLKDNVDSVEVFTTDDSIVLRKYAPNCMFCSNVDDVIDFKGRKICSSCLAELNSLTK